MKYLAACCMVKNEELMIREWMAFHRAVGFDHLIIVDNGSTDRTVEIVRSFGDPSSVTLESWTGPGGQLEIYSNIATRYRHKFYWCAFIDADEFLFSPKGGLKEIISEFEQYSAVGVHWLIYGSSGFDKVQPGYVTETYLKRAEVKFSTNQHIKSIVKMSDYLNPETAHYFNVKGNAVDENCRRLLDTAPHGIMSDRDPSVSLLRINHYYCRSKEDFQRKAQRGFVNQPNYLGITKEDRQYMFESHDRNEIEDGSIRRYSRLMKFYAEL